MRTSNQTLVDLPFFVKPESTPIALSTEGVPTPLFARIGEAEGGESRRNAWVGLDAGHNCGRVGKRVGYAVLKKLVVKPRESMTLNGNALVQRRRYSSTIFWCPAIGRQSGLEVDIDGLRRSARGLVHPKCKALLKLGRDNPRRFQMAITYLEQRAAAPARLIVRYVSAGLPKAGSTGGC